MAYNEADQVRLDWDRIVADWLQRIEAQMDAVYGIKPAEVEMAAKFADLNPAYHFLSELRYEMQSARQIMNGLRGHDSRTMT